jgi:hypothetical protein
MVYSTYAQVFVHPLFLSTSNIDLLSTKDVPGTEVGHADKN